MKPIISILTLVLASCSHNPQEPELVARKMVGLQQKFDLLDTDGNGLLGKPEIIAGYDELGVINRSPQSADSIISFYDSNRDGSISLQEAQAGAVVGPEELIQQIESAE